MSTVQCLSFKPYYSADCELTHESRYLLNSHSTSDRDSSADSALEMIVCIQMRGIWGPVERAKNSPFGSSEVAKLRRHWEVEIGLGQRWKEKPR